jgi:hypothetical protein
VDRSDPMEDGALININFEIVRSVRGMFVSFLLTENIWKVVVFCWNAFKNSNRLRFQSSKSSRNFINF